MLTADDVKALAREVGFDLCGIAPAEAFPELKFLDDWLDRGHAGEMRYLARTARRRSDVRQVVPAGTLRRRTRQHLQHRPSLLDRG